MKNAFTMIELIFVIVIIGVLSTIALPKLMATRDDAKIATIANNIKNIANEIEAYVISQGHIDTHFSSMSNIAAKMIDTGKASQNGNILDIKMNSITDCIKFQIDSNSSDANLTLSYGNAVSDSSCIALQNAIDRTNFNIALGGKRIIE